MAKEKNNQQLIIAIVIVLLGGLIIVWAFHFLPIQNSALAIDWKQNWTATNSFQARYGSTELRAPPWVLPLIWPFSLFSLSSSWALISLASFFIFIISVPKVKQKLFWLIPLLLLVFSYPSLRQIVDGNIEAIIIGGSLLALTAFHQKHALLIAVSILLIAAKMQESFLLIPFLLLDQFQNWPNKKRIQSYFWIILLAGPFLIWKGAAWLIAIIEFPWPGSAIDSSLQATFGRLGWSDYFLWGLRGLIILIVLVIIYRKQLHVDRFGFATLITASLLIGLYAASDSVITPLAIGVIPLLQKHTKRGLGLVALYYLPYAYLKEIDLRFSVESNYWTLVLLITLLHLTSVQ